MTVCQVLLGISLLLNQLVVRGQDPCSTEGAIREAPVAGDGRVLVQYCTTSKGFNTNLQWHNLCAGGLGWKETLATVVCRELPGYSDQGATLGQICHSHTSDSVILNKACAGNENRLSECGGVTLSNNCVCAEINCEQQDTATSDPPRTTTIETDSSPTASQKSDVTTTTVTDSMSLPTNTTSRPETSPTPTSQDTTTLTMATVVGAIIGVLVVLVGTVFIIACAIVVGKKSKPSRPPRDKGHSEPPLTLANPVYDDTTPTQPNYSSLGPTFDMETKPVTSIPKVSDASKKEDDFYDAEEHTYAAVNKKSRKKSSSQKKDIQQGVIEQAYPTPERDEASKGGGAFYNAEDHTYSVVNKKRAKKKTPEDGEGKRRGEGNRE